MERKTIMTSHGSASVRKQPHANRTIRVNTILNALKDRALATLNDESIDAESRAILRAAMERNDPWVAELVRRAEAEESIVDESAVSITRETNADDSSRQTIEALADIICGGGDESSGALFVLMGKLQNSTDPRAVANTVKHFAFTRCGEFNLYGMVDSQIAVLERQLFAKQ
jgi:hypothetical protein